MKQYDAIIIGFGKAGKTLAAELSNRGWQVAVVERSSMMYGGTCPNIACIPTKTLVHEAGIAALLYHDDYPKQANLYKQVIGRKNRLTSFLRNNNYEDQNGVKHYSMDVLADSVSFAGSRNDNNYTANTPQTTQVSNPVEDVPLGDLADFEEVIAGDEPPF